MLIVGDIVAVLASAALVWFLGGSAPATVDIDDAAEDVAAMSTTNDEPTSDSIDGTWTVDTTVGEFSVTDTTGTFVGFRIQEELANVGATEAVGRTPQVDGWVTVDGTTLTAAESTADMTAIVSDESRRYATIQEAPETSSYPTATFVLTDPVQLGDVTEGEVIEVAANGTTTSHGVTQPVTVPLQVVWQAGTIAVTGSFDITIADYESPSQPPRSCSPPRTMATSSCGSTSPAADSGRPKFVRFDDEWLWATLARRAPAATAHAADLGSRRGERAPSQDRRSVRRLGPLRVRDRPATADPPEHRGLPARALAGPHRSRPA